MITKIIVLLIIYILFFSRSKYSIFSHQQNYLFSNTNEETFGKNNITGFNNILNFNYSFSNTFNINDIYFKLSNFSYIFSFRFNIIQIEYNILFYYKNNTIIIPSDLTLLYNLHLICHMYEIQSNLSLDSLAFIHQNKYFKCVTFSKINEKVNFGILIYKVIKQNFNETSYVNYTHYFFNNEIFNYKKRSYKSKKIFYPLFVKKEFYLKNINITKTLKELYIIQPFYETKSNIDIPINEWKFLNLFNQYFCLCHGNNCLYHNILNYKNMTQICKYKFYLNLIEENKHLFNKTDYLLADFPGEIESLDDAFPVFQKLIDLEKNAYYMTVNKNLFQNHSNDINYNNIIKGNFINGDFLEKYFNLFLRLKVVISGAEFLSFNNIFYFIDYITFISLTHGLNYFKAYLFKSYYGSMKYDKLVISTSDKIISLAIKNGWEEKDLIKLCLPKWDKLDQNKKKKEINQNKSIFFFFTWRSWNQTITDELKLQSDYFQNIQKLINNEYLLESLNKNGIELYFCLHHMIEIYKDKLNIENKKIKYINQNEIFNSIINSNLLVTDFSSIIFEFIYLNKPYVMFIPDSEDTNISKYYNINYFNLIKDLKENSVEFMNKFFAINQVVDKIIYYINNNFQIEPNLTDFYKSFNLSCGNNTMKFINYLENI